MDGYWDLQCCGEISVADADGSNPVQVTNGPGLGQRSPAWSPDGRWIYFTSNRSGRFEIWRVPAEGGSPTQVTDRGGFAPRLSPDGRTLYYLRQEEHSPLLARPVTGAEERQVVDSVSRTEYVVREDGIYYFTDAGGRTPSLRRDLPPSRLVFLDLATGRPRELAAVDNVGVGLTVSPDGAPTSS